MTQRGFYAYIRTSTVKQGTEGVSLEVQRSDAERLARQKGVEITKFFSEMETAAKQGRPKFTQMMRELRSGAAEGLILHKIDRGARNLREWSDITDLIELGIKVHFVHDGLDLTTRGGRLTGDMLAAVAADYIRNLREETKKGIRGRLKQGFWPFGAPLGYVNNGKARPKTIDPIIGPLVRQAFELYSTSDYTLKALREELYRRGLRTSAGKMLSKNAIGGVLTNPFYAGRLVLRSTGDVYQGVHEPLVSQTLFSQVQDVFSGKFKRKPGKHFFMYRREIACGKCRCYLIGERQKGHVYYRCHSASCKGTSFREEKANDALLRGLGHMRRFVEKYPGLEVAIEDWVDAARNSAGDQLRALTLKRAKLEERLGAVTDAVIDGIIDKDTFNQKKNQLLQARFEIDDSISEVQRRNVPIPAPAKHYLELVKALRQQEDFASIVNAKHVAKAASSNLRAYGKVITLQGSGQFQKVLEHGESIECALTQADSRTVESFMKLLTGEDHLPTSPHP